MKLNTTIDEPTKTKAKPLPLGDEKGEDSAVKKALVDVSVLSSNAVISAEKAAEATYTVLDVIDREISDGILTKAGLAEQCGTALAENAALSQRLVFPGEGPADRRTFGLPTAKSAASYWVLTAQVIGKSGGRELELPEVFRTVRDACNKHSLTKKVEEIVEGPYSAKGAMLHIKDAVALKIAAGKPLKTVASLVPLGNWDGTIQDLIFGQEVEGYHKVAEFDLDILSANLRSLETRIRSLHEDISTTKDKAKAAKELKAAEMKAAAKVSPPAL